MVKFLSLGNTGEKRTLFVSTKGKFLTVSHLCLCWSPPPVLRQSRRRPTQKIHHYGPARESKSVEAYRILETCPVNSRPNQVPNELVSENRHPTDGGIVREPLGCGATSSKNLTWFDDKEGEKRINSRVSQSDSSTSTVDADNPPYR